MHGSRLAIVFNGSPLFTGGAGSGESDIRKWIIENDWLEAIIALPEQMFYNTGILTYLWIVTNRKEKHRKSKSCGRMTNGWPEPAIALCSIGGQSTKTERRRVRVALRTCLLAAVSNLHSRNRSSIPPCSCEG